MSKERALLNLCAVTLKARNICPLLLKDISELLAQPEPEQQPEAWIIVNKETGYRTQVSDLTPFLYHREIFEVIPLYTAPPKREPLSDEKLEIMYSKHAFAMDKQEYMWGFRDAERTHGIGVDNDS